MISSAALLYLGLFASALGMHKHGAALVGKTSAAIIQRYAPALSWLLILLSLGPVTFADRPSLSLILWVGLVPLLAGLILVALAWDTRIARLAAIIAIGALGIAPIL